MIHLHEAVRAVHPNAVRVSGSDVNSLEVLDENNEIITINIEAVTSQVPNIQSAAEAAEQAKAATKQSAIDKLAAIGLTADEIAHLIP